MFICGRLLFKSCVSINIFLILSYLIGVRQGENLSPIFSTLFLDDFNTCIKLPFTIDFDEQFTLFPLLYADDTNIFVESKKQLQAALDVDMHLLVNSHTTNIMIFSTGDVQISKVFVFVDSIRIFVPMYPVQI